MYAGRVVAGCPLFLHRKRAGRLALEAREDEQRRFTTPKVIGPSDSRAGGDECEKSILALFPNFAGETGGKKVAIVASD